jgi:hypothetical protein
MINLSKEKKMVKKIYDLIQDLNKNEEWRPEGNSSSLGFGIYIDEDISVERYSRNSCVYPDIDQYSSIEDISKTLSKVTLSQQNAIINALKESIR